jgi:hypothetical protein
MRLPLASIQSPPPPPFITSTVAQFQMRLPLARVRTVFMAVTDMIIKYSDSLIHYIMLN